MKLSLQADMYEKKIQLKFQKRRCPYNIEITKDLVFRTLTWRLMRNRNSLTLLVLYLSNLQ